MKLVNLTPHSINFVTAEGEPLLTVSPSGQIARVTAHTITTGKVDVWAEAFVAVNKMLELLDEETPDKAVTIPLTGTTYGAVEGLPAPLSKDDPRNLHGGVGYIVSSLVASRVPNRPDVFIPNESVRDDKGRIIGCKSLGHI